MQRFDLIVIGSGSGLEVSSTAAQRGLRVAVIDDGPFGGTCLNRGCIPSKMLIHVADVLESAQRADRFGLKVTVEGIDWPFIMHRAFEEIDREAAQIEDANRSSEQITVFKDRARFVGDKTLQVGDEQITAETVVIAAGTRPAIPDVKGLSDVPYVTSDTVMRLPEQPRRMAILGGGFIAAELAHFFGTLGTEVTIVTRGPTMVSREDHAVAQRLTDVYRRRFTLLTDSVARRVTRRGTETILEVGGDEIAVDALLVSTGRRSNADELNVAATGVEVDERGFVPTDEFLETNVPGIWALGDIVGAYLLKHSANLEAAHVTHNALKPDEKVAIDYHAMPHAVFGSPQIGSVGITEQEAQERGIAHVATAYDYADTAYGSSIEDHDGFVKVIAESGSGDLLGCHIIGTDAATLVQEVVNVMRWRLPSDAITQSIYIHPALPEVVQRAVGEATAAAARAGHAHGHEHHHR